MVKHTSIKNGLWRIPQSNISYKNLTRPLIEIRRLKSHIFLWTDELTSTFSTHIQAFNYDQSNCLSHFPNKENSEYWWRHCVVRRLPEIKSLHWNVSELITLSKNKYSYVNVYNSGMWLTFRFLRFCQIGGACWVNIFLSFHLFDYISTPIRRVHFSTVT